MTRNFLLATIFLLSFSLFGVEMVRIGGYLLQAVPLMLGDIVFDLLLETEANKTLT